MMDASRNFGASKPPLPTTFELTQIAALLSGKSLVQDTSKLARRAFQLWEACDQELVVQTIHRAIDDGLKPVSMHIRGVDGELPKSWPCSFDEALRLVMPKKRTKGERYVLFRSFLRELVQADHVKRHSKKTSGLKSNAQSEKKRLDEIETAFKAFKQSGFKSEKEYASWMQGFSEWLFFHEYQEMSAQRKQAAEARWAAHREKTKAAKESLVS